MPEAAPALERVVDTIRDSEAIRPGDGVVAMYSGGPDSTAMLAGLVRAFGAGRVVALHMNYGLRSDSDRDQTACEAACRKLEVELVVVRPGGRNGNLHDWARRERYDAAEGLRAERGLDWIAVGHTSTDLAETVLYRLASSPGTRAMAAMPARRGNIVRPLLSIDRSAARAAAVESGLSFVDDRSNLDPAFARSRIREEVLPVLGEINPGAVGNISRTRDEVEEESDFVSSIAAGLVVRDPAGRPFIAADELIAVHPAVARHAIRLLTEAATSEQAPASIARVAGIRRLCGRPEGGSVDLGGGVSVAVESGAVTVRRSGARPIGPEPAILDLPGETGWGAWRLSAEKVPGPVRPRGPEVATLDAATLPDRVEVRSWAEGDRIRQLGMSGSKPVADLFAERGVKRGDRRSHPVLVAGEEVVWVPGVAVADRFRIAPDTPEVVLLTADQLDSTGAP